MFGQIRIFIMILTVVAGSLFCSTLANAASHVALVIGNAAYRSINPLANPVNDATDMAAELSGIGYDVDVVTNATFDDMRLALARFTDKARGAEIAIIFFAGHGIEIDKQNYLIPTDATLESDSQVAFQAIPLDYMLNAVSGAKRLKVVLLDACRNNPFLTQMRSAGTARRSNVPGGLIAIEPEAGTLVGYSAKEGTTASDGRGRNSPYTEALLKYVGQKNMDVGRMFRRVRDDVMRATESNRQRQEPFYYGSLPGDDIYLNPQTALLDPGKQTNDVVSDYTRNEAKEAWEAVRDSRVVSDFQTIVDLYPGTVYERLARNRIRDLLGDDNSERFGWYLAQYDNVDLYGSDIIEGGFKSPTPAQCARECAQRSSCRAYTYNTVANHCFLKNGYNFAQTFTGAYSGFFFQGEGRQDAPSVEVEWDVYNKHDLDGYDLGKSGDTTFEACLSTCRKNSDCDGVAFVYFTKTDQCWLKSGSRQPYENSNSRKGVIAALKTSRMVQPFSVVPVEGP